MRHPSWFQPWVRWFTWNEDPDLIHIKCRRCCAGFGFTAYATEETILHELRSHVRDDVCLLYPTPARGEG